MKHFITMFLLCSACTVNAGWNTHLWTADEVRQYNTRRVDLIGKTWWLQHIEGEDIDNREEVGEKPLYMRMWVSPKPYVPGSGKYGRANIKITLDLKSGEWTKMGTWRNWEATSKWHMRTITIPIWDEDFANQIRASKSMFLDVGDLTRIHKWVIYDGDNTTVLIDHLKPKPEPIDPLDVYMIKSLQKALDAVLPKEEKQETILPPVPGQ